jgi:transcriptional regulator with XRE-family HTH domain
MKKRRESSEEALKEQARQIAARLKEEREKAHLSQMDLSIAADLSHNQVYCIETGKRIPNLLTVLKLCKALNISPASLFTPTDACREETKETIFRLVESLM